MKYFSDREGHNIPRNKEQIDIPVWNGICAIILELVSNNSLSEAFPMDCEDGRGVCGCDFIALQDRVNAIIPNLEIPVRRIDINPYAIKNEFDFIEDEGEKKSPINTVAVLDLIELIHSCISDPKKVGEYHTFFSHYHYRFEHNGENQRVFREHINELFARNGIAYTLTEEGIIHRVLPAPVGNIVTQHIKTSDARLNTLLNEAFANILIPNKANRVVALERIWDAFERLKTYYSIDKKTSIEQVITKLSAGNALFETYLEDECKKLTEIGNKFQIRHFEKGKEEIKIEAQIDYFFFRMLAFVNLFLNSI